MDNEQRRYPLGGRQLKAYSLPVDITGFKFSQPHKDMLSTAWKTTSYNAKNADNADKEVAADTRYKSPINADKRKQVDEFILLAEKDINTQSWLNHVHTTNVQESQLDNLRKSAKSFLSRLEKLSDDSYLILDDTFKRRLHSTDSSRDELL